MLHSYTKIAAIALAALTFISPVANAADVTLPALEIDNFTGDAGVAYDGSTTFSIDATVFSILIDDTPITSINIANEVFTLTAGAVSFVSGIEYTTGAGTLSAGSYLSASFTSLTLLSFGGGGSFEADLTYTGGSLIGGLTSGLVKGGFAGATNSDFTQAFTAVNITGAKAGAVIPVPAAVWLFGSGLLGLVGIARRKAA